MSGGEIAALIAAAALVLLVGLLAVPIVRLGKTLDEATRLLAGVNEQTVPLLAETHQSIQQLNHQLARVDTITASAQVVSGNVANISSAFTATVGGTMVKGAALAYGVRRAVGNRRQAELSKRVRTELKAERRSRAVARGRHHAEGA